MNQPRNVTPGFDPGTPGNDSPRPSPFGSRSDAGSDGPEWQTWWWTSQSRNVPWLGVLLVLVGAALLLQYLVPQVSIGTLFLGALAIAFLAGWLIGGANFAVIPGLLIGALAVARLIAELGIYTGPGTTELSLAVAFLLIWLISAAQGRRRSNWPLWGAAIFGLIGFVEVSGRLGVIPQLGGLWPIVVIVIGLIVLLGGRSGSRRRC